MEYTQEIQWQGWYQQDGEKTDVAFNNMRLGVNGQITGGGNDPNGNFTITGNINGNNVTFKKAYDDYAVNYNGTINQDAVIAGNWDLDGDGGAFEIKIKEVNAWVGYYTSGDSDNQSACKINLRVYTHEVYGLGVDDNGSFTVRGKRCTHTKTIRFVKNYFSGGDPVNYTGIHGAFDGAHITAGTWAIDGDCWGRYYLKKQ